MRQNIFFISMGVVFLLAFCLLALCVSIMFSPADTPINLSLQIVVPGTFNNKMLSACGVVAVFLFIGAVLDAAKKAKPGDKLE